MDTIKRYEPNSIEYARLLLACRELTERSHKGNTYKVGTCYFDLGQGWLWTTIICHRPDGESYQALNPAEHNRIVTSSDIGTAIDTITSGKYWREI